jgi:hypothetical protein
MCSAQLSLERKEPSGDAAISASGYESRSAMIGQLVLFARDVVELPVESEYEMRHLRVKQHKYMKVRRSQTGKLGWEEVRKA